MDNFEKFFLTEWKLPRTSGIVNSLIAKRYIQRIIERAPRALKTGQSIQIGSFEHTNPYNQQREIIDVRVVYEPNVHKLGAAMLNSKHEQTYWFVMFNWPAIMRERKRSGHPIRHILERVLRHEISHAIDIQTRTTDHEVDAFLPTEITAFIGDIVDDLRYMLKNKQIRIEDIKAKITKPTKEMTDWIISISNRGGNALKMYAKKQPDVIERIRKVLHHVFLSHSEDLPPTLP